MIVHWSEDASCVVLRLKDEDEGEAQRRSAARGQDFHRLSRPIFTRVNFLLTLDPEERLSSSH